MCERLKSDDIKSKMPSFHHPRRHHLHRPFGAIVTDLTELIRKKKELVLAGLPQVDEDECAPLYM